MSRNLNASTSAIIGDSDLHVFHLITFYFSSEIRLTNHAHDINYDFGSGLETFLSTGRLAGSQNIEETLKISNPTISITLTGANSADVALPLVENYNNRRVVIRRGFFDSTGDTTDSNIVADPFILFDGRVDSYSIDDDPTSGESTVTWNIASHWADWDKVSSRKCNNQNAQIYFPNEDGFSHCYDQIGSKTWGKTST